MSPPKRATRIARPPRQASLSPARRRAQPDPPRSDAIGVVLPDLFGEYFSELVRGIDRVAHATGLQLLLSNMHGSPHEAATRFARCAAGSMDCWSCRPTGDGECLHDALPLGLPAVLLNHARRRGRAPVGVDNHGGAKTMTGYLVACGYRRIAHIAGPAAQSRRARAAARLSRRDRRDARRTGPIIVPGDFSEAGGAEAARLLIAGHVPFDAIFCANDMMALGCCSVLADAGIEIPSDVGVAGFDDIPLAHYASPPLTTMKVHIDEIGANARWQAARGACRRSQDPAHKSLTRTRRPQVDPARGPEATNRSTNPRIPTGGLP